MSVQTKNSSTVKATEQSVLIDNLRQALNQRSQEIAALQREVLRCEAQAEHEQKKRMAAEAYIETIRTSASWRLTGPLRVIMRKLR
jgi:uncharacterized small protein (DUF1192 family)